MNKMKMKNFPCCLLKGPLKHDFLDIYLNTISESVTSKIHQLWGSSLFENVQNFIYIWKILKKNQKKLFFLEMIASELAALNYLCEEENTYERQSMC